MRLARLAALCLIAGLSAQALAVQAAPDAMPEQSYEEFVANAEARFPGPFDGAAFRADHPEADWAAVRQKQVETIPLAYKVDGLTITGVVVRPKEGTGLPILIWARGGVGEARIDPPQIVEMGWWARHGFIVVASNFRGAGGSEGRDEFGGGDVEDLKALLPIARRQQGADPDRIYGLGFSRGGMMLLQAAADLPFRSIATVGAPTDLASWTAVRPDILDLLKRLTPDYESESRNRFCKRSATCWAERLAMPVYLVHGSEDRSVPTSQAGLLADQLKRHGRRFELAIVPKADHGLFGHRRWLFEQLYKFYSTADGNKPKE